MSVVPMPQRRGTPQRRQAGNGSGRWMRRAWAGVVGLGVVGPLLAGGECLAQTFRAPTRFLDFVIRDRMDLRPRELATGTRTERAGLQKLDGDSYVEVYVPPACVGTRRCPLLFYAQPNTADLIPMADKYGLITYPLPADGLEATLTKLLRQFAIDPDKIAASGYSFGSVTVFGAVAHNLHVFSRVMLMSYGGSLELSIVGPANQTTQFYVEDGVLENGPGRRNELTLRRLGYPVKHVVRMDGHDFQPEAFLNWGEWLSTSWAIPDSTARPAPRRVAEVLLTPEAVNQMTAFWSGFMQLPDSIRHTARRAHLREYAVPIDSEQQVSVWMVDVGAMARQYYLVAGALQKAGLTAEQYEAYRVALVGARYIRRDLSTLVMDLLPASRLLLHPTLEPTSVLGQNVAFWATHSCELRALRVTNMWETP